LLKNPKDKNESARLLGEFLLGKKEKKPEIKCFYTFVKLLLVDAKGGFDYFYNNLNSMIEANETGKEFFAMTQKLDEMLLLNLFKEENFLKNLVDAGLRSLEANPLSKNQFQTLVATLNSHLNKNVIFFDAAQPKVDFLKLTLDQIWFLSAIKEFPDLTLSNLKFRAQMEFLSNLATYLLHARLEIGETHAELQHHSLSPAHTIAFLAKSPATLLLHPTTPSLLLLVQFLYRHPKKKILENPTTRPHVFPHPKLPKNQAQHHHNPHQIPDNHQQQTLQILAQTPISIKRAAFAHYNALLRPQL
jgi:hypothetical protein